MAFTFDYNQSTYSTQGSTALASQSQINTYMKMCLQKKVTPCDIAKMSRKEAQVEIQRIFDMSPPASDSQLNTIKELCAELIEMGVPRARYFTDEEIGDMESASSLITKLKSVRTKYNHLQRPNDVQVNQIVQMFLCPDVPFEDYGISKKTYLHEQQEQEERKEIWTFTSREIKDDNGRTVAFNMENTFTYQLPQKELPPNAWRFATPEEFAQQVRTKMSYQDAQHFISEHQAVFYDWKKSRITKEQRTEIRRLERRLGNMYTPSRMILWDAENQEYYRGTPDVNRRKEYAPIGYEPIDEMHLALLSNQEADTWIKRLASEIKRTELYSFSEESIFGEQDFDPDGESVFVHRDKSATYESIRHAKDNAEWKTAEFTKLNDLMFSLQAIGGISIEELQNEAMRIFFTYGKPNEETGASQEQIDKLKGRIKELMVELVEKDYIRFSHLARITEQSEVATQMVDELTDDLNFVQMLAKKELKQM